MPVLRLALVVACVTTLLGCQSSTPTLAPANAPPTPAAGLSPVAVGAIAAYGGDLVQDTVGVFDVTIDPVTLTGHASLASVREMQQGTLYNLEIGRFLKSDSLEVTSIDRTATTLNVHYTTRHPFPAPVDLGGPASASNRADLAVTGRVLWMIENPDAATYFAGTDNVRLNSHLITNPDGYFTPGLLVNFSSFTAVNTFPYQLLVDEAADNRVGLTNGGAMTGNYGALGWQAPEFLAGPTGYGLWSQGEASTHTLQIDRASLESGEVFHTQAAIVVKYQDPRGGSTGAQRRLNRLPSNDVLAFAYRMPHAALDVERVSLLGLSGTLQSGLPGTTSIALRVRDWDARAVEASTVDLSGEPDPTLVSLGESGLPGIAVDLPSIIASPVDATMADDDTAWGGDPEPEAGTPLDELFATATLDGTPPSGGAFTGLIRAIDPVDVSPAAGWDTYRLELAPDLAPLATHREGITYQSFVVMVEAGVAAPTASWSFTNGVQSVTGAGTISIDLTTPVMASSNTSGNYTAQVTWGDGTLVEDFPENTATGPVQLLHSYGYTGTPPEVQTATVSVHLIDGDLPNPESDATPPSNPDVLINPLTDGLGWARSWGGSNIDFGFNAAGGPDGSVYVVGSYTSPEVDFGGGLRPLIGPSDGILVKFSADGTYQWDRHLGGTGWDVARGVAVGLDGQVFASGEIEETFDLGGGEESSAGAQDSFVVCFDSDGNWQWDHVLGTGASESIMNLFVDSGNHILAAGYCYGFGLDAGGGPMPGYPGYVICWDANGVYQWDYAATMNGGFGTGIAERPGGYTFGGFYAGVEVDFGGGPRPGLGSNDLCVVGLDTTGHYVWDYTAGGSSVDWFWDLATTPSGDAFAIGSFMSPTITFDTTPFTNAGSEDLVLLHLDNTGAQVGVDVFASAGPDYGYGVAVTPSGDVMFAGGLGQMVSVGGPATGPGSFVAKRTVGGTWLWDHSWGSIGNAFGLGTDPTGGALVTGIFDGAPDFEPGPGV
ncbi:MAG: hypothetical protein ABI743_07060, partial [bacterium]